MTQMRREGPQGDDNHAPDSQLRQQGLARAATLPRLRRLLRDPLTVTALIVFAGLTFLAIFGSALARYDPLSVTAGPPLQAPTLHNLMGTDELGRDIFSRTMAGIRISLFIGLTAAVAATCIGTVVGAISGFFGGIADSLLMRFTEVFQIVPRFFLAIVLVAFAGANIWNIVIAISFLSWPVIARVVRTEFIAVKQRRFVDAARLSGAHNWSLIATEILPNVSSSITVNGTLQVGQAILLEAGLAFIGLGDPSQVSLGTMLFGAQAIMTQAWWATVFPGVFILLAVLSVNLIGDGFQKALNPREYAK